MNQLRWMVKCWGLVALTAAGVSVYSQTPPHLSPAVPFAGSGVFGFKDGPPDRAQFSATITALDTDSQGNVYVADAGNLRVRKISSDGFVTTLAGDGTAGSRNGLGTNAQFLSLSGLAVDTHGNCFVADSDNALHTNRVRLITPDGTVSTFAEEAQYYQALPYRQAFITGLAVDATGRIILTEQIANDPNFTTSLIALRPNSRSVLASEGGGSAGGTQIVVPVPAPYSSNIYYLQEYRFLAGITYSLVSMAPSGSSSALVLSQNFGNGDVQAVTRSQSGDAYVIIAGALSRVATDSTLQLVNPGPGLSPPLAVDGRGNLYAIKNNAIYKLPLNEPVVQLSLTTPGGGTVAANLSGPYLSNTVVQISATASPNMSFLLWRGDVSSTNAQLSITMDTDKSIEAVFGGTVTVSSSDGGSATRSPNRITYEYGTQVTLTAQPVVGWEFSRWSDGDTNSVRAFTFTNSIALQALFKALPQFTLNAQAFGGTGGTIVAVPSQPFYYRGDNVVLYARPAPGYIFQVWLDNNGDDPRVITMESNTNLYAGFAQGQGVAPSIVTPPHDLNAVVGGSVTFSVAATGSVPLEFQWSHAGTNITGATGTSLTLSPVQAGDAGAYTVTVSNSVDSSSATANLTVLAGSSPQITSAQIVNGRIRFLINGNVGQQYIIESSSDLHSWTQLVTLSNVQGSVPYEEAVLSGGRFYRVSLGQ